MRLLLNILWFVFGGWLSGLLWLLAGAIMAITIIGLPWAPAAFRIAGFSAWPFGRQVVDRDNGVGAGCLNVLWLVAGAAPYLPRLRPGADHHRHSVRPATRQAGDAVAAARGQVGGRGMRRAHIAPRTGDILRSDLNVTLA
jgi:hypothetical protein